MSRILAALALLAAPFAIAPFARAFDVPPEGSCASRAIQWQPDSGPGAEDVVPPAWRPGDRVEFENFERLRGWLPQEVWERRDLFFFEGMLLEVGPCYRRYPAPEFFTAATLANAGKASVDAAGNLSGYAGTGLPFAPESIADAAPDAGFRWAWNYRYRYQGSGFRGAFRITELTRGGRGVMSFLGDLFFRVITSIMTH